MIEELSEPSIVLEKSNGHILPLNYFKVLWDKNYKTVTPDFSEIDEKAFIYLLIHLFTKIDCVTTVL